MSDDTPRRLDRRTLLRATGAVAALAWPGAAVAREGGVGADDAAFVFAYHPAARNLIHATLVVYDAPERAGGVCALDDAWQHPVVAVDSGGVTYTRLYAAERLPPGTTVSVVDRVQGCSRAGVEYAGVLVDVVVRPPDATDSTPNSPPMY